MKITVVIIGIIIQLEIVLSNAIYTLFFPVIHRGKERQMKLEVKHVTCFQHKRKVRFYFFLAIKVNVSCLNLVIKSLRINSSLHWTLSTKILRRRVNKFVIIDIDRWDDG